MIWVHTLWTESSPVHVAIRYIVDNCRSPSPCRTTVDFENKKQDNGKRGSARGEVHLFFSRRGTLISILHNTRVPLTHLEVKNHITRHSLSLAACVINKVK
ncbi:unnamed protein product [Amoebophrya sp. A120]|nr:unnamed protein product [Amoebophrya sp. A120]|eukprot:GSA120T00004707001.1